MLFLLFQLGPDRYALPAADVVEVLPLIQIKSLPGAPKGVAGVMDHRGQPVPVVDLSALALGRPAAARLSTRLVLVRLQADGTEKLLALVAENATETLRRDPAEFVASGVTSPGAPYLGPVTRDARGLIQRIEVRQLLSPDVLSALFSTVEAGA